MMPDIPQIIPRTTAIKTGLVNALLTSLEGLIFSPACSEDCCDLILIKRLISASVFCRSRKEIHVTEGIVISEVAQIFIDKGADLPPFFWGIIGIYTVYYSDPCLVLFTFFAYIRKNDPFSVSSAVFTFYQILFLHFHRPPFYRSFRKS